MKPIETDLSGVSTLEKLFELWLKEHKKSGLKEWEQAENVRESTFPDLNCTKDKKGVRQVTCYKDNFHKSFCYDGFLASPEAGRKTILFICKEANIVADGAHICDRKLLPEITREENCPENFYMKRAFSDWTKEHSMQEKATDRYVELIRRCVVEYAGHGKVTLAYMNLNKRGGFGKCTDARIWHYTEMYQVFIRKEIELISPDIIICGGTFGAVTNNQYGLLKNLKKSVICRDFYHPAARGGIREKKANAVNMVTGQPVKID